MATSMLYNHLQVYLQLKINALFSDLIISYSYGFILTGDISRITIRGHIVC